MLNESICHFRGVGLGAGVGGGGVILWLLFYFRWKILKGKFHLKNYVFDTYFD